MPPDALIILIFILALVALMFFSQQVVRVPDAIVRVINESGRPAGGTIEVDIADEPASEGEVPRFAHALTVPLASGVAMLPLQSVRRFRFRLPIPHASSGARRYLHKLRVRGADVHVDVPVAPGALVIDVRGTHAITFRADDAHAPRDPFLLACRDEARDIALRGVFARDGGPELIAFGIIERFLERGWDLVPRVLIDGVAPPTGLTFMRTSPDQAHHASVVVDLTDSKGRSIAGFAEVAPADLAA